MKAWLEIADSGEEPRVHVLRNDVSIMLGRAPRRGISLPATAGLQDEHFELCASRNGCHVRCLGQAAPLTIDGVPHRMGQVPWGGDFYVGRLRLTVNKQETKRPRRGLPAPALAAAALVVLPLCLWSLWSGSRPGSKTAAETRPPAPLHPFDIEPHCAFSEAADFHARRAEEAALAQVERHAFAPSDGVGGLQSLGEAEACYRKAADDASAERLKRQREALRRRLAHTYRNARARLRLALERGATRAAVEEARFLRALLAHRDGAYVTWLASLSRTTDTHASEGGAS